MHAWLSGLRRRHLASYFKSNLRIFNDFYGRRKLHIVEIGTAVAGSMAEAFTEGMKNVH